MAVERLDHVHIEVADRDQAADWYERVLGLRRDPSLAVWAEHPTGPLLLSTEAGMPVLSLFARQCRAPSRDTTIAFRLSGAAFLGFLDQLPTLGLSHAKGHALARGDVVDHALSWSLYFVDPDGNRLEVTTYDHEAVARAL
ncbi:MAG: VOC family protein [Pseudomonadota bacterium]